MATKPDDVPGWIWEFGEDYAVPDLIAMAEGIEDMSWHNDTSPSFGRWLPENGEEYAHELKIWVEHPDESKREFHDFLRYTVVYQNQGTLLHPPSEGDNYMDTTVVKATNDPAEAMAAFMNALIHMQIELQQRKRQ